MITSQQLSDRLFQYFDTLFGADKTQFGFNADSDFAFFQDRQNNAVRPEEQTVLFYRIESNDKIGNNISSDTQIYDRLDDKEKILAFRKLTVVINFLSKKKGYAIDAHNAFNAYIQTTRRDYASYALPFPIVLVNSQKEQNLSGLEEGAWVERIERTLYFCYNDLITIGDIQFTQQPATVEDVKTIIPYDIQFKL